MDLYTLAYLAEHSDFAIAQRYVHPQEGALRGALAGGRSRVAEITIALADGSCSTDRRFGVAFSNE